MFDDALLESQKQPRRRGNGTGLPMAIGLHAAVLATLVGASVWNTGEPPEPVIPVTFYMPPAGPPPPIGAGGSVRTPTGPAQRHETAAVPSVMPDLPQPTEDGRDPAGPEYPGEIVGPPGEPDGVDNGTGKGRSGPLVVPTEDPLPVGGDVRAPELLQRVEPVYTEAARRAHIEGMVILEAIITTSGEVEEIRVLRSANPLLDEAAERALRQWRYRPATLHGRAVRVILTVTVNFGIAG